MSSSKIYGSCELTTQYSRISTHGIRLLKVEYAARTVRERPTMPIEHIRLTDRVRTPVNGPAQSGFFGTRYDTRKEGDDARFQSICPRLPQNGG